MNAKAEAAMLARKLATGDLSEIAVAFGERGQIVSYGTSSKVFKRLSKNESWIHRNFVGVYQWGATAGDIEEDIIEVAAREEERKSAMSNGKKTLAEQINSSKSQKPKAKPTKKLPSLPKRKPRKRLIDGERVKELRNALKRREAMRALIANEYSDLALMRKFGVGRSTLGHAKRRLAMSAA